MGLLHWSVLRGWQRVTARGHGSGSVHAIFSFDKLFNCQMLKLT